MQRIFILEDNIQRITLFKKLLGERFPEAELVVREDAQTAIATLESNSYWDIILLDHDLGGRVYVKSSDPNTGYQVAKHIKENNVQYGQCITHTQNPAGGKNIAALLECEYVPFPQLAGMLK